MFTDKTECQPGLRSKKTVPEMLVYPILILTLIPLTLQVLNHGDSPQVQPGMITSINPKLISTLGGLDTTIPGKIVLGATPIIK